ncbi:MAG: VCBS repeat-containing protein [Bacteroidia bacterium]|nr:VCBS repeat-containing protein [Bacteroidia bacterium]
MNVLYRSLMVAVVLLFGLHPSGLLAQTFERVESISGLGILQENNGVAVADYDGDLDLDIFVVAKGKEEEGVSKSFSRLFRNNNDGTFTDVTEEAGLTGLVTIEEEEIDEHFGLDGFKHGAFWGDYNNDGFPDLLFTHSLKVQLFINLNGIFTEVTEGAGLTAFNGCRNTGATWFDFDNDGLLDIFINDWDECDGNTLYRNNGNGTFQDVSDQTQINIGESFASYTAFPFDFNNDGWQDIYVSNDFDEANELFINQNGTVFSQESQLYGVDSAADDMAITIGDYNLDGFFDFFITAINKNILLTNNGDNTFVDLAIEKNVDNTGWAWGARFADFDLDGDEDLFVVNGYDFETISSQFNVYFKNLNVEGSNEFEDASAEVNLGDLTISVEAAEFDYDNDGDLDIYMTNADQASYFYENKLLNYDEASNLNWFKVSLQGTVSNRDAIGTELTLTTANGILKRFYTGVGFIGQSLQPVHFGLNATTQIQDLTIKWPSGLVESYQNLDSNTIVRVVEGQGLEVLDFGPSIKVYGCTDPESCSYDPAATLNDGSCTYLPSNNIVGPTSSGFFKTETYTYTLAQGSSAQWEINGGEILDGEGTNTITVKWGLQESGQLSIRENNGDCLSLETSITVDLNITEVDNDKSIARVWNEALLEAIRGDFARPTVHARNLYHTSIAMYDAWAIYDDRARPFLIGNEVNGVMTELVDFIPLEDIESSRKKAISYAAYRLLCHRFQNSPGAEESKQKFDLIMSQLGYDTEFDTSTLYEFGNAAFLGNYIAQSIINYGNLDGSREAFGYDNAHYEPINPALAPNFEGNPEIIDPNRWQPLSLEAFIDQSGNLIEGDVIDFLSPEWGDVWPFAMTDEDQISYQRDGNTYRVFNDQSDPPYLDNSGNSASSEAYKWGFSLVSVWGSHLDANDGVLWDISPKSIGNIDPSTFPTSYDQYPDFYNLIDGGDISPGHAVNPITQNAYSEQLVPRGDYARVLAEFWADGPDSETPPGHWFTILNYVNDNPSFEKRFAGEGDILDPLEWDVKAYFILGGAMHDAAISAWSIKGWYDYIRPISAIRYMADNGQSSNESLPNYDPEGIPLRDGYIELVASGDPLSGMFDQHVGKIKLYTWRGHAFIENTETDEAGVGWILAENWWPYQRPTFVTPPFAGYVSGHSTYSRAAAEVMTSITGSPYFPNGLGEFQAKQNKFLVFEEGPSMDIILQWATYRDASDQCSLSRIWGGIHPPADDIPGRIIGEKVGVDAYDFAVPYFNSSTTSDATEASLIYPNPVVSDVIFITNSEATDRFEFFDIQGRYIQILQRNYNESSRVTQLTIPTSVATGLYVLKMNSNSKMLIVKD